MHNERINKRKTRKYFHLNDNEHMNENVWDAAKAAIQGNFVALKTLMLEERFKANNLSYCLRYQEKEENTKNKSKMN